MPLTPENKTPQQQSVDVAALSIPQARNPDAQRRFTVVELQRTSQGTYVETPVRFEWTSKTRSAPRHGWEYGITLRTNREDYPGSDEPVEQVLGAHYDPQTFRGVWDDRWAGIGFSENQRVEFGKLVQRGNYVRCSFEGVTFTGIITHYKPTYYNSIRTGYEFTLSPHWQVQGGDTRRGRVLAPKTADSVQSLMAVDQAIDDALAALAAMPRPHFNTDVASSIASSIGDWQDRANTINTVIDGRVLATSADAPNSVARVVSDFQGLASSAAALLPTLAPMRTDLNLDYEAAIINLALDSAMRDLGFSIRTMIVLCFQAAQDLSKLYDPKAKALYRPRQGESLYGISNRFFGTPHRWRDIADRNKLKGFTLSGFETLVIPDVSGKTLGA